MISVICPIYNEERYIAACIESILAQDYPFGQMEVIFVDGMSTDATRDVISMYSDRYPFIRVVDNPARTVPPAMNIGIRSSSGDVVIRLDAHAVFPNDYFSNLVTALEEYGADNVGGVCRTLPVDDSVVCRSIAAVLGSRFGMGDSHFRVGADKVMETDTVPFGCFRREIFDKVGYFDEELTRNQDDEFNGRIIRNGGKIVLLPHVVIDYYARDTIGKVSRMFYQYGLFKPLVNSKLGRPATIRQFVPLLFVCGLLTGPFLFFISDVFVWLYVSVIASYLATAALFSVNEAGNLKEVFVRIYVYLTVHLSYGWGYVNGIFNMLFHRPFDVQANR